MGALFRRKRWGDLLAGEFLFYHNKGDIMIINFLLMIKLGDFHFLYKC